MELNIKTRFNIGDKIWFLSEKRRYWENWVAKIDPVGVIKKEISSVHISYDIDGILYYYYVNGYGSVTDEEILKGKTNDDKDYIVMNEEDLIKKIDELSQKEIGE